MTFLRARASSALSVVSLALGLALVTGSGCELIAGVDRNKIIEPSTTTGGGGPGGEGGSGGAGAQGGTGGGDPECTTADTCPGADTDCATRTCTNGVCDTDFEPAGTAIANQTPGDCKMSVCDGQGEVTLEDDDTDILDDMNECTADSCNMGTPVNANQPAMTACTQDMGVMCDGSGACVECLQPSDCMSGVCQLNACIPADCIDTVQNGMETDVDCGGMDCNPCADGDMCLVAADCLSVVCTGNVCQVPTCTDVVENGLETDVDCGGGTCSACGPGLGCGVDADCLGGSCSGSLCLPTCTDLLVNNQETDVDCGGPNCGGCADGLICSVGSDCVSLVCNNGLCEPPTCTDTVTNGTETDTDCGGVTCPACADGDDCLLASDCLSLVCTGNVCIAAGCSDTVENGTETDVDCGGATCPDCADGLGCNVGSDCASGVCTANVCQAPACGDGVINGADVCDDGDATGGDGCSATCTVEPGFMCAGTPSVCTTTCGDAIIAGTETCDDSNAMGGDGCSATCVVEMGYSCSGTPSVCTPVCGDGTLIAPEGCDDGNLNNGDCCSSTCTVEPGCETEPNNMCGQVTALPALAGNPPTATIKGSIIPLADVDFYSFAIAGPGVSAVRLETYFGAPGTCASTDPNDTLIELRNTNCTSILVSDDDDGAGFCSLVNPVVDAGARNLAPGTYFARVTRGGAVTLAGYTLQVTVVATCGDGVPVAPEACDDGNSTAGDGCSAICAVEAGYTCAGTPSVCTLNCGNGVLNTGEVCDDGDAMGGDGCSATCTVEAGYVCTGLPSSCSLTPETNCNDTVDNDGDSATDAADTDCQVPAYFPACSVGETFLVLRAPGPYPVSIPDSSPVGGTSTLNVTATGVIQRLAVLYNITHTFDADLDITLTTPTAASLDICSDNGGGGDNFVNTVLDTTCVPLVTSGVAPFSNCFKPETTFATFTGTAPTGSWALKAVDDLGGDVGGITSWALLVCTTP